jgi:hypothetical protein
LIVSQGNNGSWTGKGLAMAYSVGSDTGLLYSYDYTGGVYKPIKIIGSTLTLQVTAIEALTIASTGNVLIGTTTDSGYKLDVNGTGRFSSTLAINMGASTADGLFISRTSSTANAIIKFNSASADKWIVGLRNTSDDDFHIYGYTAATDVFKLASTGAATSTTGGTNYFIVQSTAGTQTVGIQTKSTTRNYFVGQNYSVADNFEIYDITGGASRLCILTNGNVGIGTTTPDRKLQVNGDVTLSGENYIQYNRILQWEGFSYWTLRTQTTGADFQLNNGSAGVAAFTIKGNNNFLIGTTTDSGQKLQVNGTTKATNYITITNQATISALSTATILTLDSSAVGVYIVQGNFGGQGNAAYGSTLIVVANLGSFRIVTNGSGSNSALTLSGANVQITNVLGINLDAYASAILIGN